jgi:hypothetical protein
MTDRRLPDYLLERLALGELPEETARQAREELAREPGGAQRLADLRASDAELLARHPPEVVAKEIARRQRAMAVKIQRLRLPWFFAPVAAFAVALLIVVLRPGEEQTQVKGDAALLVYRNRGGQSELLRNGDHARAGDDVQLAYTRARPGYGVIVSLDGAGKVTLHLPENDGEAVRLVPDARTHLPRAYGLDAAPLFERFFLVTHQSPFRTSVAVEAVLKLAARGDAARTDPLQLPAKFEQSSFLLLKTTNP